MSNASCAYCEKGEALAAYAVEIAKLDVSTLYLFKEQSHPGRVIVAYDEHAGEIADLSDARRDAYMADVAKAARAVHAVFKPDKINYGAYGDTVRHLHFHLVPKYRDDFEWNGVFAMNPQRILPGEAQCAETAEKIRKAL